MENYYKYYEIIIGLRTEYLKIQKKLEELKKQVIIEDKNIEDFEIILHLRNEDFKSREARLTLIIYYKKYAYILKRFNSIACFLEIIKSETSYYVFDKKSIVHIPVGNDEKKFLTNNNPKIVNQEFFDNICNEIYNSPLATLPAIFANINDFQSLWLYGMGIELATRFDLINKDKMLSTSYFPKTDSIYLELGQNKCSYLGEQLLNTEIPRYKINAKYRAIIDANILSNTKIFIEDFLDHDKTELTINSRNKSYILTKKI